MKLLVYTDSITPRVEYIFQFVLGDILGIDYSISTSVEDFNRYDGAKICYSTIPTTSNALQLIPHSILFDKGIDTTYSFKVDRWDSVPAFPRTSSSADIPFDIFAGAFYLVSRYEEYHYQPDEHGRFQCKRSFAARNGFIDLPLVDIWAMKLLTAITAKWSNFTHAPRKFNYLLTFDLDSAFAIKAKGLRSFASTVLTLIRLNIKDFNFRLAVHFGIKDDPFEVFAKLLNILPDKTKVKWFVNAGRYSKYDKPASVSKAKVREVLDTISNNFDMGLHPSYRTFGNIDLLVKEKKRLEAATGRQLFDSRFHYLRFSIPTSYRHLLDAGITSDYSMGYPNTFGFRASTCTPFNFFDLELDKTTHLKVYPFQCMDSIVAKHKQQHEREELIEKMKIHINTIKYVGGTFISIWHIDYLSGYKTQGDMWNALTSIIHHIKKAQ